MKIAYLVLAHNTPLVLERAISVLSRDDCEFFIHIDQKSNMEDFSSIGGPGVHFSETRLPIYWAEFSGVQATLLLLRNALESTLNPDYCVLMSGSHYPLRSGRYIQAFLAANSGAEFINILRVPAPGKPLSRINNWRPPSSKPFRRFAARTLGKLGLATRDYRKYLGSLDLYAGNTWWTLTREACHYILEFVEQNQEIVRFFEEVFVPDEALFHTILGNSRYKSRIRRNLLYEDWPGWLAHPAIINDRHVALFEGGEEVRVSDEFGDEECLFVRKFSDGNLELLDRMDEMIAQKEAALNKTRSFSKVNVGATQIGTK